MAKDLIGNYKERLSETIEVVDGQDTYTAQQIETETVRVEDPGEGPPIVLRHFFFAAKPAPNKPTKQQLVTEFKHLIETTLWSDGLEPIQEARVEVHTRGYIRKTSKALYTKMVQEHADFVIIVMCRPKKGVFLNETPTKL
jgi:hypothetical protein